MFTYLNDVEEHYSPPEMPLLRVEIVDDTLFLAIGEWVDGYDRTEFNVTAQVAVDVQSLGDVVLASVTHETRDLKRRGR